MLGCSHHDRWENRWGTQPSGITALLESLDFDATTLLYTNETRHLTRPVRGEHVECSFQPPRREKVALSQRNEREIKRWHQLD